MSKPERKMCPIIYGRCWQEECAWWYKPGECCSTVAIAKAKDTLKGVAAGEVDEDGTK